MFSLTCGVVGESHENRREISRVAEGDKGEGGSEGNDIGE